MAARKRAPDPHEVRLADELVRAGLSIHDAQLAARDAVPLMVGLSQVAMLDDVRAAIVELVARLFRESARRRASFAGLLEDL